MGNVLHMKKFAGGRMTPVEMHQRYAFPLGAKCMCGARPRFRAIVMIPIDEARKRMPGLDDIMLADPEGFMQNLVQIRESKTDSDKDLKTYFRLSVVYSCQRCRRDMDKALAKAPSWAIVEINEGPKDPMIITNG